MAYCLSLGRQKLSPRPLRRLRAVPYKNKSTIEQRLRLLEIKVESLENRVANRFATLDCNSGKYDEFLFGNGTLIFFAACTNIEPYLEGHRITLNIGNPHSFNFSNVKGTLNYGTNIWEAFAGEKKVEVSVNETIRGGSWNTINIIINPSKVEDMRYMHLQLEATTASPAR